MCRVRMVGYINNPNLIVLPLQTTCSVQLGRNLSASQRDCCHPAASMQPCHRQFRSSQAAPKHIFSNILAKAKRLMKSDCASARSSAILATLKEGISKLSGPRWFQKLFERKSHRGDISAVKLKRTDTTLDPVRLLAIDQTYIIGCWEKGGLTKPKGKGAREKRKQDSTEEEERIYTCGRRQSLGIQRHC